MPSEINPAIWECKAQYSHAVWLYVFKEKALETALVQSKKKINYIHCKRTMKYSAPELPFEFQIFFGKAPFTAKAEIPQNWEQLAQHTCSFCSASEHCCKKTWLVLMQKSSFFSSLTQTSIWKAWNVKHMWQWKKNRLEEDKEKLKLLTQTGQADKLLLLSSFIHIMAPPFPGQL